MHQLRSEDEVMGNVDWPKGTLRIVSRAAMNDVQRSRGFDSMTPDERLRCAIAQDKFLHRLFRLKPLPGESSAAYNRRREASRR